MKRRHFINLHVSINRLFLAIIPIFILAIGSPINGADLSYIILRARIVSIRRVGEVFINSRPARVGDSAGVGSTIQTRNSSAEILYNDTSMGILRHHTSLKLGYDCISLQAPGYMTLGSAISCVGKKVIVPLDTTYILDRGCVLRDCLPPLPLRAPRASAYFWVYPVEGRISIVSRDLFATTIARGISLSHLGHSIFTCGQQVILDKDGNTLYVRNLSKEQLHELFQTHPRFREKATC